MPSPHKDLVNVVGTFGMLLCGIMLIVAVPWWIYQAVVWLWGLVS